MFEWLAHWRRNATREEGQDLGEYTLLLSLITLALLLTILAFRAPIVALFNNARSVLQTAGL